MAWYFIESLHTPEDCRKALREVSEGGRVALARFYWGCSAGDHTGYAIVNGSLQAAQELVPVFLRRRARIVRVSRFTPAEVRSLETTEPLPTSRGEQGGESLR